MAPLTILTTTSAAPADDSDSDSGVGGSQAPPKTEEATCQQTPRSSASDEGFGERQSLARSRLANTNDWGLGSKKSRRKSTGSMLTSLSALRCLLTASPSPDSEPSYLERLQPLNKHTLFQNQLKSDIEKEAAKPLTVSSSLPANGVLGEAFAPSSINKTGEASEASLRLDGGPHTCPRLQSHLPKCSDEPGQSRESSDTSIHYRNEFFEVKKSGLSGLGAFALQDLKKGQRILTEPALLKSNSLRIYEEHDKLTPGQQQAYNSLCSHCPEHATGLNRIHNIYDTNSFNMGDGQCAIYLVTARFNHACPPARNVTHSFQGERQDITLRMTKDVAAGTELTLTYATCKTMLYRNWGFVCSCGGCVPLSQEELAFLNAPPTW